jgi:quinol monooxygenase YgiN
MKHLARKSFLLGLGAVLLTTPLVLNAQEEAESTRIITVQTFEVPRTEWDDFFDYVDQYVMPDMKANPHVLSYRLARHYFGGNGQQIWVIEEYADLAAVQQSLEWNENRVAEQYAEGSSEAAARDEATQKYWLPYFQKHKDEILMVGETRMK